MIKRLKKFLLTCYFVYYKYHLNLNRSNPAGVYISALIILSVPVSLINITLYCAIIDGLGLDATFLAPTRIAFIGMGLGTGIILHHLLFKRLGVKKDLDNSSDLNIAITMKSKIIAYLFFVSGFLLFFLDVYLKNGYIVAPR